MLQIDIWKQALSNLTNGEFTEPERLTEVPKGCNVTQEELRAEAKRITDEINKPAVKTYREKRIAEYPFLQKQLEMLWDAIDAGAFGEQAKDTDLYKSILAIKDKYPKDL